MAGYKCTNCPKGNLIKTKKANYKMTTFINPINDSHVRVVKDKYDNQIIESESVALNIAINGVLNRSNKTDPKQKIISACMELACSANDCEE